MTCSSTVGEAVEWQNRLMSGPSRGMSGGPHSLGAGRHGRNNSTPSIYRLVLKPQSSCLVISLTKQRTQSCRSAQNPPHSEVLVFGAVCLSMEQTALVLPTTQSTSGALCWRFGMEARPWTGLNSPHRPAETHTQMCRDRKHLRQQWRLGA